METRQVFPPLEDRTHFRMVDVGEKVPSHRVAQAQGSLRMGEKAFVCLRDNKLPKGNALQLAEAAAIMAAKKTSGLIPLCHQIPLDQVEIQCALNEKENEVVVTCKVSARSKTGVEMEALVGTMHALLCLYDLIKGVDPDLLISEIRLNYKLGGKSGKWIHPSGRNNTVDLPSGRDNGVPLRGVVCAVVTISDRSFGGERGDISGPALVENLTKMGAKVVRHETVSDEQSRIGEVLRVLSGQAELIVTTGGTGLGPRDVTPEALHSVCDRIIPGIGERLRSVGAGNIETACLSRSSAGLIGRTLVISLPGNPKAVLEGLGALSTIIPHALHVARGGNHE